MSGRSWRELSSAGGLTDFGANLVVLEPGAWSSQRHWHTAEDELVVVASSELTLVTDAPEEDACEYPDIDQFWSKATGYVRASERG